MAGAVKHMERSRRSHRVNRQAFSAFERNAYKIAQTRQSKADSKTLSERLIGIGSKFANMLRRNTANK